MPKGNSAYSNLKVGNDPAPERKPQQTLNTKGRKAKGYKQIGPLIPPKLYQEVKVKLAREDRDLSEVTERLLQLWVEEKINE